MTQIRVEVSSLKAYNNSLKENAKKFAQILSSMGGTNDYLSHNWKGVDASVFSIKSSTFINNAKTLINSIQSVTSGNDKFINDYLDRIDTLNL